MITQERLREVVSYNKETGVMTWIKHHRRRELIGRPVGTLAKGYVQACIDQKLYYVHRLAFLLVTGGMPDTIDHINGNKADNRWENLRASNHSLNQQNLKKANSANKTGYLGVHKIRNKFCASIQVNKKVRKLGLFNTAEEAHDRYLEEKRRIHEANTL